MAFVIIPDNKPTRSSEADGRVVACLEKYLALEQRIGCVENQIDDIREHYKSNRKTLMAITLALVTGIISVMANVFIKMFA